MKEKAEGRDEQTAYYHSSERGRERERESEERVRG